eukprot:9479325-Alexandrium_andersonii.AAC.1
MGGSNPCVNSKKTPVTCKRAWVKPWSDEQMGRAPRKKRHQRPASAGGAGSDAMCKKTAGACDLGR